MMDGNEDFNLVTMPIDRVAWYQEIHFSNFVNSYYQYRDIQMCQDTRKILEIGPGQGLSTQILWWKGYNVTTLDVDETFEPDHVGSVHDLHMFHDCEFDVVVVSHVLEHLPLPYLDASLQEIARVGRYALIYLPVSGRHCQIRFIPGVKGIDLSFIFDLFNWFHKPDGVTPRYCSGQHYWEVGMRGFRVSDLLERFDQYFEIVHHYRNRDWNPSYNFVLKSKVIQ